jgi:NADPH:quinone reductase-like Zn-dependent oxidoreductase
MARPGLSIGQRVFGLTDWYRDGTLTEYVAVEARNLIPLPGDVDFTVGAALVMPGLTAWQGVFEHGRLHAGKSVLVHDAAGVVGSMASQGNSSFVTVCRAAHKSVIATFCEFQCHL